MDFNNIKQMLQNGVAPDDIINQFSQSFNQALRETQEPENNPLQELADIWQKCLEEYVNRTGDPGFDITALYFDTIRLERIITLLVHAYKIILPYGELLRTELYQDNEISSFLNMVKNQE